jgi:subtilisin family serine protease
MKSFSFSLTRFLGILFGSSVLVICFGCQKESIETDYAFSPVPRSNSVALASTTNNNYMVISKSITLPASLVKKISSYGEILNSIPEIGILVVKPTVSNFETKVAKLYEVQAVVPDLVIKWIEPSKYFTEENPPSLGDDEPFFGYQWGMDAIEAPEAWNAGYTGKSARVFILDSGIDAEHPDLSPNLIADLCTSFVPDEDYNVADGFYFNHGTHVAGIIAAADNGFGVIGVAPEAEIVAVKVISEYSGSGAFSWINKGIVYAATNGADVINMSLGATIYRNGFYYDEHDILQKMPASYYQMFILATQRAVDFAFKKGAVIVTSAGNDGLNMDGNGSLFKLPGGLHNVITVSATAPDYWYRDIMNGMDPLLDIPSSYTDYGKSFIEVAAPGGDFDYYPNPYFYYDYVLSTTSGGWAWASGTSMASPHVAGVAALIIGKNGGEMNPHEVTKQLLNTADKIDGEGISAYFGNGRVNAFRAVIE